MQSNNEYIEDDNSKGVKLPTHARMNPIYVLNSKTAAKHKPLKHGITGGYTTYIWNAPKPRSTSWAQ